jgi:hypothetical protein
MSRGSISTQIRVHVQSVRESLGLASLSPKDPWSLTMLEEKGDPSGPDMCDQRSVIGQYRRRGGCVRHEISK